MSNYYNRQWRLPNNENKDKQSNYSMDFDGSSQFIDLGNSDFTGTTYSFSLWFKSTSTSTTVISEKVPDIGGVYAYRIYLYNNGDLELLGSRTSGTAYNDGNWHHLAVVQDTSLSTDKSKGYIDGNLVTTSNYFGNTTGSNSFYIGCRNGSQYFFNGQMDGISIFDYALTDGTGGTVNQIAALYGSSSTGIGNPMSLSPKPVAYYPLGDQDAFNGSNYLVPNSSLKDYVFSFDGNDDYINAGNDSSLQFQATDAFSISAWININGTTSGADFIVSNGLWNTYPYSGWGLEINGANTIRFDLTDDNVNQLTIDSSGLTLNINTWYNVVFTYDGSSSATGMNFYLDGSLTSKTIFKNQTLSTITYTSINLNIGARENGVRPFNGSISNVQIFNTALPATGSNSIETLYNNGSPLTSMSGYSSLVGWWKLDASATYDSSTGNWTIEDSSSNSNDGTSSGMTQANLVQSDLSFTSGYSPYALEFDGTDDYIDCGNDSSLEITGNFTISAWVNITSSGYYPRLLGKSNTSNNRCNYGIGFYQNKPAVIGNSNGTWIAHYNSTALSIGVWHHIVGVYNGTNFLLYANGSLDTTNSASGFNVATAASETSGQHLYIGASTNNTFNFNGSISNASIWNAALTSSQVTEIYNEGVPQNLNNHSAASSLVSWWQLGSNSSFNSTLNQWTCIDEKGTNTGESSQTFGEDAIVDGVGSYANGVGTSGLEVIGSAPFSDANSLSVNMDVEDRVEDTPS